MGIPFIYRRSEGLGQRRQSIISNELRAVYRGVTGTCWTCQRGAFPVAERR